MKTLLTISTQDFDPAAPKHGTSEYGEREAARAVLLDADDCVYLLHVSKHGYHKLPGGGVREGEEIVEALRRELLEEVGCKAEVIAEVGRVDEYRDFYMLHQVSYCYLARQIGKQKPSALEEGELADGMYEVKAKNIDDAIRILEQDKPDTAEGVFIQRRDLALLKAAKELL